MSASSYPMLLKPRPSRRLWGGRRLGGLLGTTTPAGADPVGEVWLVYEENPILNGALYGRTLRAAAEELGADLLGTAAVDRYGTKVPLLVKLIDAAEPLSIQVHPDDAFAQREEADTGHLGKEEAWYILDAEPDARIVWGFAERVDAQQVREAVRTESLERLVNGVGVAAGDVIYNPAGTVHAVGAGIFLFEVQQSSDITYRLYDYGRRDASGATRELHLDKALAVADLAAAGDPRPVPIVRHDGWTELVRTPYFVMERRRIDGAVEGETSKASMETLTFTTGGGTATGGDSDEGVEFAWNTIVLPAALGAWRVEGSGELIRCRLPDDAS